MLLCSTIGEQVCTRECLSLQFLDQNFRDLHGATLFQTACRGDTQPQRLERIKCSRCRLRSRPEAANERPYFVVGRFMVFMDNPTGCDKLEP
jgi:hypothetical protein